MDTSVDVVHLKLRSTVQLFSGKLNKYIIQIWIQHFVFFNSKLQVGSFPSFESIVAQVINAKKGIAVENVKETQPSNCVVL